MLLPDDNVKIVTTHTNNVINIYHFDFDDEDHFLSLSDDGQIIEWSFNKETEEIKEIEKCNLVRPNDELLLTNNHQIPKIPKGDYIRITKSLIISNFIFLGYEDGLILVYLVEKQEKQKNEEEEEENQINKNAKNYYNSYSLLFILLGHTQKITALYFVEDIKLLVSASDTSIVKVYNMENGHSMYHFNLDCIITKIELVEKKTGKNLVFLCDEPYKLVIDISKEPISFNHYTFKYNDGKQLIKGNKEFYILGNSTYIYKFNNDFDYVSTYSTVDKIDFDYICPFGNQFIIFDNDNFMRLCELKEIKKENRINMVLRVKCGKDNINFCYNSMDKFLFSASQDNTVYFINIEKLKDLEWERNKMNEEDALSAAMLLELGKKKGKGKGKGAKGKGGDKKEKLPKIKKKK